ncbi:MAG: hypothetical protein OEW62_00865 [Candidatus Bathyarchaeota archaeon]|nr:hypothetical protein [Candidatus Bathyarchaeota archaeon]
MSTDALTWSTCRTAFENYRWDVDYYDPVTIKILENLRKQSSHNLSPRYGLVHALSTVKKAHGYDNVVKALSVRDVESGFIYPHVPRFIERPQHGNFVAPNTAIVTRAGIQGIAAPVIESNAFWDVMGHTYSLAEDRKGLAATSDLLVVEAKDELSAEVLAAYISSPIGRSITRRVVYGVSNRHLRRADLASIPIPDSLYVFDKELRSLTAHLYETFAKIQRLGNNYAQKIQHNIGKIRQISSQKVLKAKLEHYRFDFSWYQFKKIRDLLLKSGFSELGNYISEIKTGGNVKKAEAGVLVLGTRDLKPYIVLPRGEKPRIVEQIKKRNWATSGQLLMAEVGGDISVGTTAFVPSDCSHWKNLGFSVRKNGIAVSPDIIILSLRSSKLAGFITSFLNSFLGRLQLKTLAFTTKQTRVRPYEVDKILVPEPESSKEHFQLLEEMYKSIISIRRNIDIEIPRKMGFDPVMVMKGARPYIRRIKSSSVTLDSYA